MKMNVGIATKKDIGKMNAKNSFPVDEEDTPDLTVGREDTEEDLHILDLLPAALEVEVLQVL